MRLISQDGTIDLPYEQVVIQRFRTEIYFLNKNLTGVEKLISDMEIAKYSTEAKAQKAMEMLRTAYTGTPLIFENCDVTDEVFEELKRRSIEAILTVTNDKPKVDYLDNFYFQFPKDEDLEV